MYSAIPTREPVFTKNHCRIKMTCTGLDDTGLSEPRPALEFHKVR